MNKFEEFSKMTFPEDLVPHTDEEVKSRSISLWGKDMGETIFALYSIYRERDNLNVLDAYDKVLKLMANNYDKMNSEATNETNA